MQDETSMRRTSKRVSTGFRLEVLESRTLLSVGQGNVEPSLAPEPASTLLVRFAPDTPDSAAEALFSVLGAQEGASFPDGPTIVSLPIGADVNAALAWLRSDPLVVYAEANQTLHLEDIYPGDPFFTSEWGLNNPNDVDIDAPQAWSITTGSTATIVAVIDSGIDMSHGEFAGRLWTNPVDGSHGWNFITNTSNIQDDNSHGTHVAGILAASANNGIGGTGVNWNAQIMALKFIGKDGSGSIDAAVSAIYYAVQHGARVINASWAGPSYSQALNDAINYAGGQGVVMVVAAGNNNSNNDITPIYPADNRLPNVISVAAVDSNGSLASFSDYGPSTVDLAAPGVNIRSTVPGGYASYSGTSMAAPFVAGVVSLVIGQNPSFTAAQIVQRVLSTVKPLPSLVGLTTTGGMVDAYNALATSTVQRVISLSQGLPTTDLTVYRWQTADWISLDPTTGDVQTMQFGEARVDIPVAADYDGGGGLDFAVFRPSTAQWFIWGLNGPRVVQFGQAGVDIPVPADYDGDGKTDIAVFRPTTATWFVLGTKTGPWSMQFGQANWDQPVPADYDGDGVDDIAVFRPDTAEWFMNRSSLGRVRQQFGIPGQSVPVPGDYDGDHKADLSIYEPASGLWYSQRSTLGLWVQVLGPVGLTIPVPSDYDHDGVTDPAVYQFDTGQWFMIRSRNGYVAPQFGAAGFDMPITSTINYLALSSKVQLGAGIYQATAAASTLSLQSLVSGAAATSEPASVPVATEFLTTPPLPASPAVSISRRTHRDARIVGAALEKHVGPARPVQLGRATPELTRISWARRPLVVSGWFRPSFASPREASRV
jgi:subtilisin family serine protease